MEELLKCENCKGEIFYSRVRLRVAKDPVKAVNVSRRIKGDSGVPILTSVPDPKGETHAVIGSMTVLVCEKCGKLVGNVEGGETDEDRTGN